MHFWAWRRQLGNDAIVRGKSRFEQKTAEFYILLNHWATARGSNRTQVPTRNEGIRPEAACLKIVTLDTERNFASSSAVKARPIFSIWSAIDIS